MDPWNVRMYVRTYKFRAINVENAGENSFTTYVAFTEQYFTKLNKYIL
jgi:hypothetical protein